MARCCPNWPWLHHCAIIIHKNDSVLGPLVSRDNVLNGKLFKAWIKHHNYEALPKTYPQHLFFTWSAQALSRSCTKLLRDQYATSCVLTYFCDISCDTSASLKELKRFINPNHMLVTWFTKYFVYPFNRGFSFRLHLLNVFPTSPCRVFDLDKHNSTSLLRMLLEKLFHCQEFETDSFEDVHLIHTKKNLLIQEIIS